MNDQQILKIAHRMAWRYKSSKDRNHSDTYTFNDMTMLEFARRIMAESADTARIDWLADVNNSIGNVQLPSDCVLNNTDSLRGAIDEAMIIEQQVNDL